MTNPSWRKIDLVKVPAKPDGLWTMVVEHITGPRLLRLKVSDKDKADALVPMKWNRTSTEQCGADGQMKTCTNALLPLAPCGSLIAKIGGSTADMPEAQGVYSGRKVFTVGTYCVVLLANTDTGGLFLTMNDAPESFNQHALDLYVLIEEAPV